MSTGGNRDAARSPLALAAVSGSAPLVLVVLTLTLIGSLNRSAIPTANPDRPASIAKSTGPQVGDGKPATDSDVERTALEPLRQFLDDGASLPQGSSKSQILKKIKDYHYEVDVLIATLPDPRESHLAYMFDAMLEAIHRAIEVKYIRDRFLLPWPAAKAAQTEKSDKETPEIRVAQSTTTQPPWFRRPGTLLFRERAESNEGDQTPRLLVLFLVGETPTWGVQESLKVSLDLARDLAPTAPQIKILGPTFSGSASSLSRRLGQWWKARNEPERPGGSAAKDGKTPEIWVCTGSATAIDKEQFESGAKPASVWLAATVIPDSVALKEMLQFLGATIRLRKEPAEAQSKWLREKVVILAEAGTAYGTDSFLGVEGGPFDKVGDYITIPFPLHIAYVRGALGNQERGILSPLQRGHVPIPIDEVINASDRVPSFAPRMSTAVDALVLERILATIRNERVRYVGILATDVLDTIFLTGLIRDHCPDVQLFVPASDFRFTDPDTTFDFRGAFVVSSYPLDLEMQAWCFPHYGYRRRRMFPTDEDFGVYNAALMLDLAESRQEPKQLTVKKSTAHNFLAYGPPYDQLLGDLKAGKETRPAVWISQIGQGNVWPVKAIPLNPLRIDHRKAWDLIPPIQVPDPNQTYQINPPQELPRVPIEAITVALICAAAVVLVIWLLWMARIIARPMGLPEFGGFLSRVASYWKLPNHPSRTRYALATFAVITGILLPSTAILWGLSRLTQLGIHLLINGLDFHFVWLWCSLLIACLCAGGLAVIAVVTVWIGSLVFQSRWLQSRVRWLRRSLATSMVALVLLVGLAVGWMLWPSDTARDDWLSVSRWLPVFNGVSPILPLLILGFALVLWGGFELQLSAWSSQFLSEMEEVIPGTGENNRARKELADRWRELKNHIEKPVRLLQGLECSTSGAGGRRDGDTETITKELKWIQETFSSWRAIGTFVVVLGTVVYVFWWSFFRTPASPWLGWVVATATSVTVLLLTLSLIRLVQTWWVLKGMLQCFGTLPITESLKRLAPKVENQFRRFFGASIETEMDWYLLRVSAKGVLDALPSQDHHGLTNEMKKKRTGIQDSLWGLSKIEDMERLRGELRTIGEDYLPFLIERFDATSGKLGAAPRTSGAGGAAAEDSGGGAESADARKTESGIWPEPAGAKAVKTDVDAEGFKRFEDDLTLRLVLLVRRFAVPLRAMMAQVVFGSLLLCLATAWYPFQPQRLIAAFLWGFLIVATLTAVVIILSIDREPFISRASGTTPGSVTFDWSLVVSVGQFVVPTLAFLVTAFPSVAFWLRSLLAPLSNAMR